MTAKANDWEDSIGKACRKRAIKRCGHGWNIMSEDMQEAFIAREVVLVLLAQAEESASDPVKRLQAMARTALRI